MSIDADIQVWLEQPERVSSGVVVPYVVSAHDQDVRYRVRTIQESAGNRAVTGQTGTLRLMENTPAALSRLSLSRHAGDHCVIEVTLHGAHDKTVRYQFECP